jgi:hypothetical protein
VCGLAACVNPLPGGPSGPYASPTPAPAQRVILRGCNNASHEGPEATDVGFVTSSLLRQESDLQRVADDISGAVPGGDPPNDARLAQTNAHSIVDLINRSTLCSPFREKLAAAARDLAAADDALAGAPTDVSTLEHAQSADEALKSIAANPPSPASARP